MATVIEKIRLNASPEKIWSFIFDKDKLLQWRTDIIRFEIIDKGDTKVGSRFFIEKKVSGKLARFDCKMLQIELNRKFAFEGEAAGVAMVKAVYEIIPQKYGCGFVINETVDALGLKFLKPLIDKLFIQKGLSKTIRGFLNNLQLLLENQQA